MKQQFDKVFKDAKKGNLFGIFKILEKHDPDLVKSQVMSYSDHNESFYTYYLRNLHIYENSHISENEKQRLSNKKDKINGEAKEFLEFCEKYGYSLKNDTCLNNNDTYKYGFVVNKLKETMPDYLVLLKNGCNDDYMLFLTEKLGKDYCINIYNEWNILPYLYKNNYLKTIKQLTEYGCVNNQEVLEVLKSEKPQLMSFYWEMVEINKSQGLIADSKLKDQVFQNDIEWLTKNINYLTSIKDNYKKEEITHFLDQRMLNYTREKNREVLGVLLSSKNTTHLSHAWSLLKTSFKKYENQEKPLWLDMGKVKNHNILYAFFEKNIDWQTYHESNDTYFLNELFKSLTLQAVALKEKYRYGEEKKNESRDLKIMEILDTNLEKNFWLQKVPSENRTWYAKLACNHINYIEYFNEKLFKVDHPGLQLLLKIEKQEEEDNLIINEQDIKNVKESLELTYFSQDTKGLYTIESIAKQKALYNTVFNNKKSISILLENNLLSEKHQEILLQTYLNNYEFKSAFDKEITETLYHKMINNHLINWRDLKIVENDNRKSILEILPFYFEIKTRIFKDILNEKIPQVKPVLGKKKL